MRLALVTAERRFKHCHGAINPRTETVSDQEVRDLVRKQEAAEMLRRRQQGHGKPLITVTHNGYRFVAVGKRLVFSRSWKFFPDFLLDNMQTVFGRDWIHDASTSMPDHPLIRWLERLQHAKATVGIEKPIPYKGYLSALIRLGYALYLIEHNDKPAKSLIKRLRKPNDFDPACYEALVAATFALAGAAISGAEDTPGSRPKPEFFATFKGGKRFSVEAKRKRKWNVPLDFCSEAFAAEIRSWLRDKLHAAGTKELDNPVYWLELGIGVSLRQEDADRLRTLIVDAVTGAESITVKGRPARPAYVVVTNNADFADEDLATVQRFAIFMGFRMEDFRDGVVDPETAMEWHDRHRDIRRALECLEEVQQVPASFEGVPDELLDENGQPISTLTIGDMLRYPKKDGTEGVGRIAEITSSGSEAYVMVHDEEGDQNSIIKVPLTEREANAAKKLGDAIFGKPVGPHGNITDPLRLYDWFLSVYADFDREGLLRQLEGHPQHDALSLLPTDALRVRVAREVTKRLLAESEQRRQSP